MGRLIVEAAVDRGHLVTTFNRGRTGGDAAGAEAVHGDRENAADLARLVGGREWDAVIDTSGYVPAVVGNTARLLSGKAAAYAFMSTVSVYPDWPQGPVSEDTHPGRQRQVTLPSPSPFRPRPEARPTTGTDLRMAERAGPGLPWWR